MLAYHKGDAAKGPPHECRANVSVPSVLVLIFSCVHASIAGCAGDGTSGDPDGGDDVDAAGRPDSAPRPEAGADSGAMDAGVDAGRDAGPPEDGPQFVWPLSSWVAANEYYATGSDHSGSADLAIQLRTPIRPARHGVVEEKRFSLRGGHLLRIRHEGEGGQVYETLYSHLADEALVEVGDEVGIDTLVGYVGRVGNANFSGPHVHFALLRVDDEGERERLVIPGLEIGEWVDRGEAIPGEYEGLEPTWWPEETFDVRVVDDVLYLYETTSRAADERIRELSEGEVLTVLETERGQYRVEAGSDVGWVAHSGTVPIESPVFDVRVTASVAANVRREPTSAEENRIGAISDGLYLTAYERGGSGDDWVRVLWPCNAETNRSTRSDDSGEAIGGCPGRSEGGLTIYKYGWMGPAVTEESGGFQARTRVEDLDVYGNRVVGGEDQPDCPCNSDGRIGQIEGIRRLLTVNDTRNGWYRIDYEGEIGWVRGWLTAGRQ